MAFCVLVHDRALTCSISVLESRPRWSKLVLPLSALIIVALAIAMIVIIELGIASALGEMTTTQVPVHHVGGVVSVLTLVLPANLTSIITSIMIQIPTIHRS